MTNFTIRMNKLNGAYVFKVFSNFLFLSLVNRLCLRIDDVMILYYVNDTCKFEMLDKRFR